MEEEATEDIYRLANVSDGDLQVFSPVSLSVRKRLPWLLVNLFTAFLAASVVSLFETTIAKVAVLAVFQSIVAGQGGNAGTQTLAMMVRGMALGEIEFKDAFRALAREAGIGVLHGIAVGICVGIGAYLWKGIPVLGVVISLAMVGNMIAAGIAGTLVPLTLRALKLDPALASAVIVTTVTDCVGFGLFLGLATLFLPYLQ
ncbi:MAG: magnesium transporter [Chloroflexota bacterium]